VLDVKSVLQMKRKDREVQGKALEFLKTDAGF
jgi:hypothetical protein